MRHSTAGNGTGSTLRCYRQRGTRTVRLLRNKKSQERKPGNANAGHPDRHEKARAELTGAAGSYTSSAPRVRHCWLANIDLAPAFVRHNHALGLLATTPVGSTVPGLILAIMAVQLIVGRTEPVFPNFIMTRRLPTKQLLRLGGRAIHVLKYLEKVVHPGIAPAAVELGKEALPTLSR